MERVGCSCRDLAATRRFEHPHDFVRAERLWSAQLHDHVSAGSFDDGGSRCAGHILIRDPADRLVSIAVHRTIPFAASKPKAGVNHTSMKYEAWMTVYAIPEDFSARSTARLATVKGNWIRAPGAPPT
jgi:hypothetical protein